jgi:predicted transcriptional regulator
MHHDEAFEFFMEVKNKEIKELKEKLERDNAASNAMINAGIRNRRKMTEAGDALAKYIYNLYDIEHGVIPSKEVTKLIFDWEVANHRVKTL